MAEKVIQSLANRILELENMVQTRSDKDPRFVAVNDKDTFDLTEAQQNANTRRMTDCNIKLFVSWLQQMNEMGRPDEISPKELDVYIAKFISIVGATAVNKCRLLHVPKKQDKSCWYKQTKVHTHWAYNILQQEAAAEKKSHAADGRRKK